MGRQPSEEVYESQELGATMRRVPNTDLTASDKNSKINWGINPATRNYFPDIL